MLVLFTNKYIYNMYAYINIGTHTEIGLYKIFLQNKLKNGIFFC